MTTSVASAIRPSLRENRQHSGSPHTPNRFIASTQSSPGSSLFRQPEDPLIFELDVRSLSAGFSGESGPQCVIPFNPENSRRLGDFRSWAPGFRSKQGDLSARAKDYELWRNDLGDVDLGLLEDRLERAVRDAYYKYLLVDAGLARLVLVLPSLVPHPVLSAILTLFFERWKIPSITLLPSPTMATVAAGLRSGVVIDIGWEETVITAVYEYREVHVLRTTQAMKALTLKVGQSLEGIRKSQSPSDREALRFDFDLVEEMVCRISACGIIEDDSVELSADLHSLKLENDQTGQEKAVNDVLLVEWPTHSSSRTIEISKSSLKRDYLEIFLGNGSETSPDDQEQPVGQLLYMALVSLSSDTRSICMSRLMFTGTGSTIVGLPQQIIRNTEHLAQKHGWTSIRGKHLKKAGRTELAQIRAAKADARHDVVECSPGDPVDARLLKQKSREAQPITTAQFRQVETFGPWAGASLVSNMRVKSFVEIDRERFLSHGLAGAHRDADMSADAQQRSAPAKAGDRSSWTLAGWG